eukprot:symbB.v1.2.035324.t1/scaffold4728.1/size36321/1
MEPDEAGDDEKDTWSWWKGCCWDWDSQEKRYIEVEQRDKAGSVACGYVASRFAEAGRNLVNCGKVGVPF